MRYFHISFNCSTNEGSLFGDIQYSCIGFPNKESLSNDVKSFFKDIKINDIVIISIIEMSREDYINWIKKD